MVSTTRSPPFETATRSLGALSALSAGAAAVVLLSPNPLADAFFAGWVAVGVGLALVAGVAAWTNRPPLLWLATFALAALCVVGMWSIGLFFAPAAALALGAALLSRLAGAPEAGGGRRSDPPTDPNAGRKALAGAASAAVGAVLVYVGAFARELFGSCARETLDCATAGIHWDAMGTTLVGLLAVGLGGWSLWRYGYLARTAARSRTS